MSNLNLSAQEPEIRQTAGSDSGSQSSSDRSLKSAGLENTANDFNEFKTSAFNSWRASDFMTRDVLTIPAEATLREAAEIFALYNISGAPVLNTRGNLVGMLSESDLIIEAQRYADIPRLAVFGFHLIPGDRLWTAYRHSWAMEVNALMSTRIVTASPDTPLLELARMIATHDVNRIPIVENHRIVGIITRADIVRAFSCLPTHQLKKEAWRPPHALQTEDYPTQEAVGILHSPPVLPGQHKDEQRKNPGGSNVREPVGLVPEVNGYDGARAASTRTPSWVAPGEG